MLGSSEEVCAELREKQRQELRAVLIRETEARLDLLASLAKRIVDAPVLDWASNKTECWVLLKCLYTLVHWDRLCSLDDCRHCILPLPSTPVWVREPLRSGYTQWQLQSGYTQWQRGVVAHYEVEEGHVRMMPRVNWIPLSPWCHTQPLVAGGAGVTWTTTDPGT